jgi:hypothetical protein
MDKRIRICRRCHVVTLDKKKNGTYPDYCLPCRRIKSYEKRSATISGGNINAVVNEPQKNRHSPQYHPVLRAQGLRDFTGKQ